MTSNLNRRRRARRALVEYLRKDPYGCDAAVIDLMTDLRHLCRHNPGLWGVFEDAVRLSGDHHDAEA